MLYIFNSKIKVLTKIIPGTFWQLDTNPALTSHMQTALCTQGFGEDGGTWAYI